METKRLKTDKKQVLPVVLTCFFLTLFVSVQGQNNPENIAFRQYNGEVEDSQSKNPLVFATITLEGTNISTVTNTEGQFSIKIPENLANGNLTISFL